MSFRVDVLETANNHRTEKGACHCAGEVEGMEGIEFVFMVMTSGVMFKIKI